MGQLVLQPNSTDGVDTYINAGSPNDNHGGETSLIVGWQTGKVNGTWRSLLRFDLSGIPNGASIAEASLTLCITSISVQERDAWVRRITQEDWTEAGATWNKYDGTSNWSTGGGDFTVDDEVAWVLPVGTGPLVITGLKALATAAIQEPNQHMHMILIRDVEAVDNDFVVANSSDTINPSQRPKLIVSYELPPLRAGRPDWGRPADGRDDRSADNRPTPGGLIV